MTNVRTGPPLFTTVRETNRPAGSPVENVEISEVPNQEETPSSANSTNSTLPASHVTPPWPADSVLHDYMLFARQYSESQDTILIGSLVPIVAALLGRRVFIRFGARKYPNLYNVLVTRPGFRKTTSIELAERLGRQLLPETAFLEGSTSDQALFKLYQTNPDRLLIEDEGNTLFSNWQSDAAGKMVAKRFLKLYDCKSWQQAYVKQAEDGGDQLQRIAETSTSLLVGTTYNNCRFNGLETRDGLRRRVNYYTSEHLGEIIYWPTDFDSKEFAMLCDLFRPLTTITGEFHRPAGDTLKLWKRLQEANRGDIQSTNGIDAASEAYSSALAEESAKTLKFAMIFELCRWARDHRRQWQYIQPDTLQTASEHVRTCLHASRQLENIARRSEIREQADAMLANIRVEYGKETVNGEIGLSKTQLTHRFAPNPNRSRGAMTTTRLYGEIIPDLVLRELVRVETAGKLQIHYFKCE